MTSPTNFAKREGAPHQKQVECTFISLAADPETDADLARRAEDAGGRLVAIEEVDARGQWPGGWWWCVGWG